MTTTELAQRIEDRLDVLHGEIARLEAARIELRSNDSGPAQPTPGKRRSVRRPKRVKRTRGAVVVSADKLEQLLAEHSPITSTELAKLADGGRDQVLALLRELEAAGRLRRTGQRRGTRWHAITDEDRIKARAAELEQQSRRGRSAARRPRRTA